MLTGCGQGKSNVDADAGADSGRNNAKTESGRNTDEKAQSEEVLAQDESGDTETAKAQITLYNGVPIDMAATLFIVGLDNKQVLDEEQLVLNISNAGEKIAELHFPAENTASATVDMAEGWESECKGSKKKDMWFSNFDKGGCFDLLLDNETGDENVDGNTLPVTGFQTVNLEDKGTVSILGVDFSNENPDKRFSIQDAVAVWGDPIAVEIDNWQNVNTREKFDPETGENFDPLSTDYTYYYRFKDGYIKIDMKGDGYTEGGVLDHVAIYQWDTLVCEEYNLWNIPKFSEEE